MAKGRPRKATTAINCRVAINTIELLMATNPSLLTRDPSTQELKFRHGALGRYVERLILEDIAKRRKEMGDHKPVEPTHSDRILAEFLTPKTTIRGEEG